MTFYEENIDHEYSSTILTHAFLPIDIVDFFTNMLMLFPVIHIGTYTGAMFVPPAWTLTIEICFYVLICLGVSKSLKRTLIWLSLSLCYVVLTYVLDKGWSARYFSVLAASLPFALGSLCFFVKWKSCLLGYKSAVGAMLAFLLNVYLLFLWADDYINYAYVANLIICFIYILSVASDGVGIVSKKVDVFCGNLSYPFYLFHFQSILIVSYLLYGVDMPSLEETSILLFFLSLMFLLFISVVVNYLLNKPIDEIRNKVRGFSR